MPPSAIDTLNAIQKQYGISDRSKAIDFLLMKYDAEQGEDKVKGMNIKSTLGNSDKASSVYESGKEIYQAAGLTEEDLRLYGNLG